MITVPQLVEEIITRSPFLEEGLKRGLINLSSLAREIQPEIQQRLSKDIKLGAIVMALKRLSQDISQTNPQLNIILDHLGDITVRSAISEFTFTNSHTLIDKQRNLFNAITSENKVFLTITHGVFETSLFASSSLDKKIAEIFADERLRAKQDNLSSITIIIPEEATHIPGVYYSILKHLAWAGINFIEVVSSFTELTIFLESKNVDRAFSVLKKINS